MNFNIVLPGFEEVQVTKMEQVDDRFCFHVEMPISPHTCPACKKRTSKIHDYRMQKIKHLKIFERPTLIFYRKHRYGCSCGKRFAEKSSFVHRYQHFSLE